MVIDLKQCVEILKENDNFLVLSHEHPDGDTLGSAFALMAALKKMGKKRAFKCSDEITKDFSYMLEGFECDDVGENPFVVAVDVADVVLVKCHLINPTEYSITKQGAANADVQGGGNGINVQDVIAIQKNVLKMGTLPIE
jgi:hypothetical protein